MAWSSVHTGHMIARLAAAAFVICSAANYSDFNDQVPAAATAAEAAAEDGPKQIELIDTGKGQIHSSSIRKRQFTSPRAPEPAVSAASMAVAEGDRLLRDWRADSSQKAIEKYNQAFSMWSKQGSHEREQAGAFVKIGDVREMLGELGQALEAYDQTLRLCKGVGDRPGQSNALSRIGMVFSLLSENQKALASCKAAFQLSRAANDLTGQAQALYGMAEAQYGFGHMQESVRLGQKSLRIWRDLKDPGGQARALLDTGYAYSDLGDMREASECYSEALSLWTSINDLRWQGVTLTAFGRLYSRLGESQHALKLFGEASRVIQQIGDPIEEGRILTGTAYIDFELDNKKEALENSYQALALFQKVNYLSAEADTYYGIGAIYYSMGDYKKALEAYNQDIAICKRVWDRRTGSFGLRGAGAVYALEDQKRALECYRTVLPLYRKEKDIRGEADTLNLMGQIYEGLGAERAQSCYQRALSLSRAAEYQFGQAEALFNIARYERGRGRMPEAREAIEKAIAAIESVRGKAPGLDLRTSYFASVRQYYEFYIDLLMTLNEQAPSQGFDIAALEACEAARARSLIEVLEAAQVGLGQKADPMLVEQAHALRQEIDEKAEQQVRLLETPGAALDAYNLTKEIGGLKIKYEQLEAQLQASDPEHGTPGEFSPLHLPEIQKNIDADAVLLEYSLGKERSFLWMVTGSTLNSYELPGRESIEELASAVRSLLIAPAEAGMRSPGQPQVDQKQTEIEYWHKASILTEMVLGPVAAQIENKRLVIVADGALQYIPFAALPVPGAESGQAIPLVFQHEISYQVSGSALAVLRGKAARPRWAAGTLAIFADPVFEQDDSRIHYVSKSPADAAGAQGHQEQIYRELRSVEGLAEAGKVPRLMASRAEADAIVALTGGRTLKAIGFEANKATVTGPGLGRYRIIHFATHSIVDSEKPELSGLVLSLFDSQGRPQDGFLNLDDIYNLDLPADLVVLSSCDSGLGKSVNGEGLIGLTRGFMYAGASRVMASLWREDDQATAELMKSFYKEMLQKKQSPPAALRNADIAMSRRARWHMPYYWAGFIIEGEYDGTIDAGSRPGGDDSGNLVIGLTLAAIVARLVTTMRRTRRTKPISG
jgi:CHAT domain-containing protein/tetratricopeptide (TPR) repeat protein